MFSKAGGPVSRCDRGRGPRCTLVAAALFFLIAATPADAGSLGDGRPLTTIAIVGEMAINPLHAEFRTRDGRDPVYPSGMPAPEMIPFPRGDFEEAMSELARGPLGTPSPGQLYGLSGTRLLIYGGDGTVDLLEEGPRSHGTASASAAAGLEVGTSPDSLIVHVPQNDGPGFEWLADQQWIDLASTSVYSIRSVEPCEPSDQVRVMHQEGGLLFSSSGNTTDIYEPFSFPNGVPEVFQVGGVDRDGRTWLPGHIEEPSPFFAFGTVVRPYEVGARFSFEAADGDSLEGMQPFGGTSGAAPTVAGYGLELIAEARRILGDAGPRTAEALARIGPAAQPPRSGPLADGNFTRDELVDLLHRTATPFEPPTGVRYLVEGYGASDARSQHLAIEVLRGDAPLPARPDEDTAHAAAEDFRRLQASRC